MASLTTRQYRVVALPGEGIGPEVVEAALKVLRCVAELEGFSVQVEYGLVGNPALQACSSYFPNETAQRCKESDGILFGAVAQGGLLELRQHFDLFC